MNRSKLNKSIQDENKQGTINITKDLRKLKYEVQQYDTMIDVRIQLEK